MPTPHSSSTEQQLPVKKHTGRGAVVAPVGRFERTHVEQDWEQLETTEAEYLQERRVPTEFLPDESQTIIAHNDSPDVGFSWSVNPYRGCEHGCAYCYARPTHEYLGLSGGIDFETKIYVKHRAAELLRQELAQPSWRGEPLAFSGVTDCYQPAERKFRLTRGCLEVASEAAQAVSIVTKNALITRDMDVLTEMARRRLVNVYISVTTLDAELARKLEPRTSAPAARLRTIETLTAAGVPVGVLVAPLIPGLNDGHAPGVLAAAGAAGAISAGYVLLRLPYSVRPVFEAWLDAYAPDARPRVEALVRATRRGKMNGSEFGTRMRGQGPYAEQISALFRVFRRKHGLDRRLPELDTSQFSPPLPTAGQLRLF